MQDTKPSGTTCGDCGEFTTNAFRFGVGPITEHTCRDCASERASTHVLTYIREGVIRSGEGAEQARLDYLNTRSI